MNSQEKASSEELGFASKDEHLLDESRSGSVVGVVAVAVVVVVVVVVLVLVLVGVIVVVFVVAVIARGWRFSNRPSVSDVWWLRSRRYPPP